MAEAHHALKARRGWLRFAPAFTLALLVLPIAAGLVGTLLPAFGHLPALGQPGFGLEAWRALAAAPGFDTALQLTLATGWAATLASLALALAVAGFTQHRPWAQRVGGWLAPLLAMPHASLAIGLAFVIAPSGWLVRAGVAALSPWLGSGWETPPDVSTIGHPSGWPLVLALLLKEVPYLLLMTLAATRQVPAQAQVAVARSLGYGPVQAWFAVVLPQVYPQLRLPVAAVLAFSLSVVDVAYILGPGNPPTLAALAVRWFAEPDTRWVFPAAAAATLLLAVVAASLVLWRAGERGVAALAAWRRQRGVRSALAHRLAAAACAVAATGGLLAGLAVIGIGLWAFAGAWRYPAVWPSEWTLATWQRQATSLAGPALNTLGLALASTAVALALVLACLEAEARGPQVPRLRGLAQPRRPLTSLSLTDLPLIYLPLIYLPLLVPQVAFLFGLQVLLVRLNTDGTHAAVAAVHLLFVLPYVYLSLADPWRSFDPRYARSAASLGAGPARVFWRIKLPLLRQPVAAACAVGFAVSAGQYLPTLFAGAGRVATLTTEAVTLSAGADRRVVGTWALLQAALPLAAFWWATRGRQRAGGLRAGAAP